MSSAQTEAFVQALAPHLVYGDEQARDAAERLPHTLQLMQPLLPESVFTKLVRSVLQMCVLSYQ